MVDTTLSSLDEFRRNLPHYIDAAKRTQEPVEVAVDGATVVIQNAESYRRMSDELERMRLAIALLEGEVDIAAGRTQDADEFFAELEAEYGVQD